MASSLGARLRLNTDAVKTEVEGFDPENHIPEGKQAEVFKILKEFLKGVKEPPSWWAQWKDKREKAKATKQAASKETDAEAGEKTTKAKDDEKKEEVTEEVQTGAPADAGALPVFGEGQVASQDDEFKAGDIVMGIALKGKDKWAQKGKIVKVLSKHYTLEMLEGGAIGESHKFLKACVAAIPAPEPPAPATLAAASSETATGHAAAPADDEDMKGIETLFD